MQKIDLQSKLLLATTDKNDGNIDARFSDKSIVKQNRKKIFHELGLNPADVIEAEQVHGTIILPLNEENAKMWRGTVVTGIDGFISDDTELPIMIRIADCVPLVYYDPTHHTAALIHAGWKGTAQGIHLKALELMQDNYDTNPKEVLVWLGPSAHGCCYESDEEPNQINDSDWKPYIQKKKNKYLINIPGYIVDTLNQAGVYKKNITTDSTCTVTSNDYFSHTRSVKENKPEGRFAVILKLQ